jgi:hypothetical protein
MEISTPARGKVCQAARRHAERGHAAARQGGEFARDAAPSKESAALPPSSRALRPRNATPRHSAAIAQPLRTPPPPPLPPPLRTPLACTSPLLRPRTAPLAPPSLPLDHFLPRPPADVRRWRSSTRVPFSSGLRFRGGDQSVVCMFPSGVWVVGL